MKLNSLDTLRISYFVFCISFSFLFLNHKSLILNQNVYAQTAPGPEALGPAASSSADQPGTQSGQMKVRARVGEFTLVVSGVASPKARITLFESSDLVMATQSATTTGDFGFSDIPSNGGLTGLCLLSADQKKLGTSLGCLKFESLAQDLSFQSVFLPPTIGLQKAQIEPDSDAIIYGYSMPGAKINIKTNKGKSFDTASDATGYYEYKWQKVPAGTYLLSATGAYKGKNSLASKSQVTLTSGFDMGIAGELVKDGGIWAWLKIIGIIILVVVLIAAIGGGIYLKKRGYKLSDLKLKIKSLLGNFKNVKQLHNDWFLDFMGGDKKEKP